MNKSVKKILVSGVALIMLAATGTGVASSTNVNASRHARTYRLRHYRRHHIRRARRHRRTRARYSRTDMWYFYNARRLYGSNRHNKMFRYGYKDAGFVQSILNMHHAYNNKYREGWITGYLAKDHGSSLRHHSKGKAKLAVNLYGQGMNYAQNGNYRSIVLESGNQWYDNVGNNF